MISELINNIKINKEANIILSDKELELLYYYLEIYWEELSLDDKQFWIEIVNTVDPW